MNKVYVVTSGEYSDYGINAIFDNKELAEEFAMISHPNTPCTIEEWELNTSSEELKFSHICELTEQSGDLISLRTTIRPDFVSKGERGKASNWNNKIVATSYISQEHAVKLALEKRQEILRENA